jgi:hypothetical protein
MEEKPKPKPTPSKLKEAMYKKSSKAIGEVLSKKPKPKVKPNPEVKKEPEPKELNKFDYKPNSYVDDNEEDWDF